MNRMEKIHFLIDVLLEEIPEYHPIALPFAQDEVSQRRLLRSLMNVRPPMPLTSEFLKIQDEVLSE